MFVSDEWDVTRNERRPLRGRETAVLLMLRNTCDDTALAPDLLQDFGAAPILLPRTMKTISQLEAFTCGGVDGILLMEGASSAHERGKEGRRERERAGLL